MVDLSAPLRLTWDLPADPVLAAAQWRKICAGRVLFLEVRLQSDTLSGLAGLVAEEGAGAAPRCAFLGDGQALAQAAGLLPGLVARSEWFLFPPFPPGDTPPRPADVGSLIPSLWSDPKGLEAFAGALEVCLKLRLPVLAILNPPGPALPLQSADRDRAVATWRRLGADGITLRVHDLFLAEALGLEPFRAYRGCQAGSTLGHLTATGRLLACRTLPLELGDLSRHDLPAIWGGPARAAVLARLAEAPHACRGCSLAQVCGGGCRGLGRDLERDPSCPGSRDALVGGVE